MRLGAFERFLRRRGSGKKATLPAESVFTEQRPSAPASMMQANSRILAVGHEKIAAGVSSAAWETAAQNIADFDVVILDCTTRPERPGWQPSTEQWVRFLRREGARLYVVGANVVGAYSDRTAGLPRLGAPFDLRLHRETGTELTGLRGFEDLFKRWSGWRYRVTVANVPGAVGEWNTVAAGWEPVAAAITPIAVNRSQEPLALAVTLELRYRPTDTHGPYPYGRTQVHDSRRCGEIVWIPDPVGMTSREVVEWLLSNHLGVAIKTVPPVWADVLVLPGQKDLEQEIGRRRVEMQELEAEIGELDARLLDRCEFRRLLFEQGTALEAIVHRSLELLGATVTHAVSGGADGLLEDERGRPAVLEIKGTNGGLSFKYVRQLEDWVVSSSDAGEHRKGLLIVNLDRQSPPTMRDLTIEPNALAKLRQYKHCLVHTGQLFAAVTAAFSGSLDRQAFWNKVFDTDGVLDWDNVVGATG